MNGISSMSTPIDPGTGWRRFKGWAAVFILLSCIIGFGPGVDVLVDSRHWISIGNAPPIPGFQKIEKLPPPFELHYPGVAQVWAYSKGESSVGYTVVVFYQREAQGSELVSSENGFLDSEHWRQGPPATVLVDGEYEFSQVSHRAESQQAVNIFSQYRFASFSHATSPLKAKIYALRDVLMGGNGSAQISILTRGDDLIGGPGLDPGQMQALTSAIEGELAPVRR